jgi:hypothetical protein
MSWQDEAKKIAAGKWLRFEAQTPEHVVTFVGEPKKIEKEGTQGDNKGVKYWQMQFPVEVDDEPKFLEPNKSLLNQLLEEDHEESIIGATFRIKCINLTTKREWKVKRLGAQATVSRTWDGEDKEKEKFMEKAGITKEKRTKKPKAPKEGVAVEDAIRESEENSEDKEREMEQTS